MEADVLLNGNTVQLKGNVEVTANERELDVSGPVAGYAFHDRSTPTNRYVWYANQDEAHLYRDGVGNVLTIKNRGTLRVSEIEARSMGAQLISAVRMSADSIRSKKFVAKGEAPTGTILIRWDEPKPGRPKPIITKDEKSASAEPIETIEREMDLVKMILDLQTTIVDLEKRLRTAEDKVGITSPIIIKR